MAKVKSKSIMVCSDCDERIYVCDGCGDYFRVESMIGKEEIICNDGKHYHSICKVEL